MTGPLAAINNPALVTSAGAAALSVLPVLERTTISWNVLKMTNALLFALNMFAVSLPGRLDGNYSTEMKRPQETRSLIQPAGWAFSIWAFIFLGEMIGSIRAVFVPESSYTATILSRVWPPFMVAQLCQILWTAAFRPKYFPKNHHQSLSPLIAPALLSSAAVALSRSHRFYTEQLVKLHPFAYWTYCFPLSLHFGWMSAASLLNWNNSIVSILASQDPKSKDLRLSTRVVNCLGHASALLGGALGVVCTLSRKAPVYGAVISWALTACADTLLQQRNEEDKQKRPSLQRSATGVQLWLCRVGAALSTLASVVMVGKILQSGDSLQKAAP